VPRRDQLLGRLRAGRSYPEIGREFGVPAGQAYLIVTGLPADGSDVLGPESLASREGILDGSSQHLANPPTEVPTEDASVLAWTRARAAADLPMRQASQSRTAEPPEPAEQAVDLVDVLGQDHNQVNYLAEQLQAIPGVRQGGSAGQQQQRVSIVDMIRIRLARHETAEEEHLWPTVRAALPDGAALADTALEQEQHGKDLLQALDGLPGDADRFDELVEQLVAALRKHVAFEDLVFGKVKQVIPAEQRAELGRRVQATERHAPTRPHPHAPPGSRIAAAAVAPIDRLRDAVTERPAERAGRPEQPPDG
jgi:Hemerythrin HHE cation binding domain